MIKNIILTILLIVLGILAFAILIAAMLDTKGKTCAKLLAALFVAGVITQCVARYC